MGERGVIQKARKAAEEMERAQLQEELELIVIDLQVQAIEERKRLNS